MEGEPLIWHRRFERFRLMEPTRSIAAVFREEMGENGRNEPPGRWYEESKKWQWEERAVAWDAYQTEEQERTIAREKEKVLRTGFALMHKRVEILNELCNLLIEEAKQKKNMYISSPKETRFNDGLYTSIDRYLNSIAAEMGERVKKKDITVTEIPPSVYLGFDPDQDGIEQDGNEAVSSSELQQNTDNQGQQAV